MNAKKLVSMILALVMLLALGTSAMAEDATYTITVPNDGHTYEVYQIFYGDLTVVDGAKVLSNVMWGENAKRPDDVAEGEGQSVSKDVLDKLAAVATSSSNVDKLAVIAEYVDLTTNALATLDKTNGLTYSAQKAGYYLIKDKDDSINDTANDSYTTYVVQIVGPTTIKRKADVPKVEKKIVKDENEKVDENNASIGDTINYEFVGTMPTNIADYKEYFYKFTDTLSAGLTYNNDLKVFIGETDVTEYFYVNATQNADSSTTLVVGTPDLLAFKNLESVGAINLSTKVTVKYSATLNANAAIGEVGNKNDVELQYDNNPNDDGEGTTEEPEKPKEEPQPETGKTTGKTPKDEVWTYVTEIVIEKVDQDGNALTGAGFTLTGEGVKTVVITTESFEEADDGTYYKLKDGTYTETAPTEDNKGSYADTKTKYKMTVTTTTKTKSEDEDVTAEVGEDGKLKFTGLGAGVYTISETTTPAGYNSIPDFTVTIGWTEKAESTEDCDWTYTWSNDTDNSTNTIKIQNQAGSTLPETGGMGTTVLYIAGGLLVAAAVIMMITRRRAGAAE